MTIDEAYEASDRIFGKVPDGGWLLIQTTRYRDEYSATLSSMGSKIDVKTKKPYATAAEALAGLIKLAEQIAALHE